MPPLPVENRCGHFMPIAKTPCVRPFGHDGQHYSLTAYTKRRSGSDQWRRDNSESHRKYRREQSRTVHGKAISLLHKAKQRAMEKGIPFDLTLEWVEIELETVLNCGCPYLGIPIRLDTGNPNDPHNPSIDQFYPGAGYTKDNCIIVSYMANKMKQDASPGLVKNLGDNVDRLAWTRFPRRT